ncbi:MAG: hypothetical protein ACKO5R_15905, partial [Planctomycetaceae bacterium]
LLSGKAALRIGDMRSSDPLVIESFDGAHSAPPPPQGGRAARPQRPRDAEDDHDSPDPPRSPRR